MLPSFEKCVVGMEVGDKQFFKVPQAFGPRRQELVVYADKNDFPENREPAIGKGIQLNNGTLLKIGTTQNQRKLFFNLAKARDKLLAEGLRPEPRLLAERLDVKEEEVVEMTQRLGAWEMSLDSPVGNETEKTYGSILADPTKQIDDQISERQKRELLKRNLDEFRNTLSGKEADIFENRIIAEKPLTLQQLGEKYHISRERVRQIQNKIIGKVRKRLQKQIPNFRELYMEDTAAASG